MSEEKEPDEVLWASVGRHKEQGEWTAQTPVMVRVSSKPEPRRKGRPRRRDAQHDRWLERKRRKHKAWLRRQR